MAHARVAFSIALSLAGCQGSTGSPAPRAASEPFAVASSAPENAPGAPSSSSARGTQGSNAGSGSFDGTRWGTFHSKRFELSLPLPDGSAWRIDDHASHWLRADHEATRSVLWVRSWPEEQLVTRKDCYARARDWNPSLPDIDGAPLIDDRVRRLWNESDARVAAGMRASDRSSPRERGFVVAVAGELRRCMVVVFETEATGEGAPLAIADRLAFVSDRVLPKVRLDPSLAPPRQPLRGMGGGKDR
jgi:hypothetical protein